MLNPIDSGTYTKQVLERFESRDKKVSSDGKIRPNDSLDLHCPFHGVRVRPFFEKPNPKFWQASREQREEYMTYFIQKECRGAKYFVNNPLAGGLIRDLFSNFLPTIFLSGHRTMTFGENFYKDYLSKALVDDYQLAVCMLALMKVNQKEKEGAYRAISKDKQTQFGYKLCDFLLEIGATKFAQKLDSTLNIPLEWKAGLVRSKDQVEGFTDEEFEKRAAEVLPEELWQNCTIGEKIGIGTYLDTRVIKINPEYLKNNPTYAHAPEGAEFVLQLVKPNEVMRTNVMLDLAERLSKINTEETDEAANFIKRIAPILRHNYDNIKEEIDMRTAKDKAMTFADLYKDMEIKTPDLDIDFKAPMIFDHDEDYRINLKLEGEHFADLPETSETDLEIKRQVGMGILISELHLILSGQAYDHDRHDKNQKVLLVKNGDRYKATIGNFDENGLVKAPNKEQKKLLANLLMDAVELAVVKGEQIDKAIAKVFGEAQQKAQANSDKLSDENRDYIITIADAMQSLMNYVKYLDRPGTKKLKVADMNPFRISRSVNNILTILKTLQATGKIDKDIVQTIKSRAKQLSKRANYFSLDTFTAGKKLTTRLANLAVFRSAKHLLSKERKNWSLDT